ncbi:MAG: hypothetical protein LUC40_02280, partial [Oscillospiraceae bacterium]|nr:hypothetical protein [Oscillospiraceae bacterium]
MELRTLYEILTETGEFAGGIYAPVSSYRMKLAKPACHSGETRSFAPLRAHELSRKTVLTQFNAITEGGK